MSKRDYYEILGVSKNATFEEIRKAYRTLAIKHHPDKHQGDKKAEEKFKEISEAYEILSDDNKKATYDRFGHEGLKGTFGGGGFNWQNFTHFSDLEDIFGNLGDILGGFGLGGDVFGGGYGRRRKTGPTKGRDLERRINIEFAEAALGVEEEVEITRNDSCTTCKGTGASPGTKDTVCTHCGGRGQISTSSGFFNIMRTCNKCGGSGRIIKDPCKDCRGSGKIRVSRKIKVKIPAGVSTGIRLRVSGEGDAGERGGPRGDLYVVIHAKDHELFKRHNNDIYCELKINFTQAVFGADVNVPTLTGDVKLKIPKGTQVGKIFRLRGMGVPDIMSGSGKGDELVRISIDIPKNLNSEQMESLRKFSKTLGEKGNPRKFMDKVKKVFE